MKARVHLGLLSLPGEGRTAQLHQGQGVCANAVMAGRFIEADRDESSSRGPGLFSCPSEGSPQQG